jgi:hypothetical protein
MTLSFLRKVILMKKYILTSLAVVIVMASTFFTVARSALANISTNDTLMQAITADNVDQLKDCLSKNRQAYKVENIGFWIIFSDPTIDERIGRQLIFHLLKEGKQKCLKYVVDTYKGIGIWNCSENGEDEIPSWFVVVQHISNDHVQTAIINTLANRLSSVKLRSKWIEASRHACKKGDCENFAKLIHIGNKARELQVTLNIILDEIFLKEQSYLVVLKK